MSDKFIKKDYKMFMAGKLRTFDEVVLKPSKFNPNNPVLSHLEFDRIAKVLAKQLIEQPQMLTMEEVEFLRATLKVPSEQIKDIINAKPYNLNHQKSHVLQDLFRSFLAIG